MSDCNFPTVNVRQPLCSQQLQTPDLVPDQEPPPVFLSVQQSVACELDGDLASNITLPSYLSIAGNSLIMAGGHVQSNDSQAAADAAALAQLQNFFDASIASGDLECPEPPLAPPSIPNSCGTWWKADSLSLTDGARVGEPGNEWLDSTGNARNLTQSVIASQPLFRTNIFGTRPAVQFDGIDDFLNIGLAISQALNFTSQFGSPSNECTIFMLFKQTAALNNAPILIEGTSDCMILSKGADNTMFCWDGQGTTGTSAVLTTPATNPRLIIFRNKIGVPNNFFRENKTNKGSVSQSNLGFDFRKVGGGLSDYLGAPAIFFNGYIAEIIAYCATFTDAECDNFYDNYFKVKYPVLP